MNTRSLRWLTLALPILLNACGVGPQYRKPLAPEPVAADLEESGTWKQAAPRDAFNKGKWWEIFKDPKLNELEEQVAVTNKISERQEPGSTKRWPW